MAKTWREKVDAVRGLPVPDGLPHGRQTWARKGYGCACKVCLPTGRGFTKGTGTPQRERMAKLRESKAGQPVPAGTRHGYYAYKTYKCRCEVCRAARSAQEARRVLRRRSVDVDAPLRGAWTVGRRTTIVHWKPLNAGPDWACPTCGMEAA